MSTENNVGHNNETGLQYDLRIVDALYDPKYEGPPRAISLEEAMEICGVDPENRFDRSSVKSVLLVTLADMFFPMMVAGKPNDVFFYYPHHLALADNAVKQSCRSDFERHNWYGRVRRGGGHRHLKAGIKYEVVLQQRVDRQGNIFYARIFSEMRNQDTV